MANVARHGRPFVRFDGLALVGVEEVSMQVGTIDVSDWSGRREYLRSDDDIVEVTRRLTVEELEAYGQGFRGPYAFTLSIDRSFTTGRVEVRERFHDRVEVVEHGTGRVLARLCREERRLTAWFQSRELDPGAHSFMCPVCDRWTCQRHLWALDRGEWRDEVQPEIARFSLGLPPIDIGRAREQHGALSASPSHRGHLTMLRDPVAMIGTSNRRFVEQVNGIVTRGADWPARFASLNGVSIPIGDADDGDDGDD